MHGFSLDPDLNESPDKQHVAAAQRDSENRCGSTARDFCQDLLCTPLAVLRAVLLMLIICVQCP
jgi:hypothetical protein